MFLNNQQVTEEIKREIKKISRNKWQWKHDNSKPVGCSKSSSKREIYSNTILSQETRKHRIDSLSLHLKQLEKEEEKNPKISRRKEIIKNQAEINEKEMKETIWFFEKTNKIDKPLARFIKKKREINQLNKTRNEKGAVTTNNAEIQRIIRDYSRVFSNTTIQKHQFFGT